MLFDHVLTRNGPGLKSLLLVFFVAIVGAWLAVLGAAQWKAIERADERFHIVQQTAEAVLGQATGGGMLGAVSLLGLSEPLLKEVAKGHLPPDDPGVLARLAVARGRFQLSGAYVFAANGTVVAHETSGDRTTGMNLAFRPYFQRAIKGNISVYAAIGSNTQERGLYYAAPLYDSETPSSRIIGVVMFKGGFEVFDMLLQRAGLPAVLLSPQGVAFSSTRPEWRLAVAPPLTQERIDSIRASRQFGNYFDKGVASALPFAPDASEAVLNGATHAIERRSIEWNDPAGPWQLVMIDDVSNLMTPMQRVQVGGGVFAALSLLGLLLLDLQRSRRKMANAMERFRLLGVALENSPVAVVITDGDGRIDWVNPQYERNTGYGLEEVRGLKPSVVASGKTSARTYQAMWATLLSGQSWRGHFVNRRKDGSIYQDDATLLPVFDERGRRIGIVGLHEDISRRMEAQEEIERRERMLSEVLELQTAIFDNAPPFVMVVDEHFRKFNPAYLELIGGTAEQVQGLHISSLFGGDTEQAQAFSVGAAPGLAANEVVRATTQMCNLAGRKFAARLTGRRLGMASVRGASIWLIEDITEQRQSEAAVQQAKERLELAQEAGKIGVFDVDIVNNRLLWNDKLEAMLGVEPSAEPRAISDWLSILHPQDRERARERFKESVAGSGTTLRDSWRVVRPDGEVRWFLSAARIFRDESGKALRAIGVNVDIHDQKLLEERVAEQLDFQQALIDAVPVPLFYKGADGRYIGFNRAFEEAFNVKREKMIGKTVRDMTRLASSEMDEFEVYAEQALRDMQVVHKEVEMPYADGKMHHTLFWLHGFARPDGSPGGAIGTFVDISDRKRVEVELLRAKELAEESTAMKSNFLANMSHEIRTPMNAIIGMSHLALKSGLNTRQHDYVSKIQQAGQHLLGVINDILDFSKIEAGKMDVEKQPFALDRVLESVSDVVGYKAGAKGLELVLDVACDIPPNLVGDALRLGQILINFANNAIKFTDQGEISIVVRLEEERGAQVRLRFEVRDTGIGLKREQIGQLFQSFQQADTSTTRSYGGTGLGLAICKSLAELMGGSVGVESSYGRGSIFWASLPMERGAPARVLQPPTDLLGRRVLVVDDNQTAATVLADMLHSMGFEVEQAHSGLEALERLRESVTEDRPFSLLLLDWQMPGMDGVELAGHIRTLGMPQVPQMLMVTAYGRDDVMRAAKLQGIESVLIKPVNASLLFDTLMQPFEQASQGPRRMAPVVLADAEISQAIYGARVLLVEDNELNQMVAVELLQDAGFAVDVVENGKKAIEFIERKSYDVVLMDMQMPVMDGETATRLLRKDPRFEQLPIVAMTANAMDADRQRCFDAGMNDHVSKPIDPAVLWAALGRWIRPRAGLGNSQTAGDTPLAAPSPQAVAAVVAQPSGGAAGASNVLPRLPGLDTGLGLRRALGKPGLYTDLLRRFVQGQSSVQQQLEQALAEGDVGLAERLAHTLHSVAANIGAQELSHRAQVLEHALRNQLAQGNYDALLTSLESPLLLLLDGLRMWMAQSASTVARTDGGPTQGLQPQEAVQALRDLLQKDDPAATEYLQNHATLLKSALLTLFKPVEMHILNFDFEQALEAMAEVPSPDHSAAQSA
jgi:two-component system sensor histidine kinase/response regulator